MHQARKKYFTFEKEIPLRMKQYYMKNYTRSGKSLQKILFIVGSVCLFGISSCQRPRKPKVLVFSKNTYFFHTSIPNGNAAIIKLGAENGFDVDTTTNAEYFTEDSLKKYAAIIFLSNADN